MSIELPAPDMETHRRLMSDPEDGSAIMSAVVAMLVGTIGRDGAARILREWADAIQIVTPAGRKQ